MQEKTVCQFLDNDVDESLLTVPFITPQNQMRLATIAIYNVPQLLGMFLYCFAPDEKQHKQNFTRFLQLAHVSHAAHITDAVAERSAVLLAPYTS